MIIEVERLRQNMPTGVKVRRQFTINLIAPDEQGEAFANYIGNAVMDCMSIEGHGSAPASYRVRFEDQGEGSANDD